MSHTIQIKHRFTGQVLYDFDPGQASGMTIRHALEKAVSNGADLCGANLRGADLCGANLCGADLRGANLRGEILKQAPVIVEGLRWDITISDGFMKIGCQRHTHAEWAAFSAATIHDMDSDATEFWDQWSKPLLLICAQHAAAAALVPEPEPVKVQTEFKVEGQA